METRLITPRGIRDMKKCLAYGPEGVIILSVKGNPQLAVFQVSLKELEVTVGSPCTCPCRTSSELSGRRRFNRKAVARSRRVDDALS